MSLASAKGAGEGGAIAASRGVSVERGERCGGVSLELLDRDQWTRLSVTLGWAVCVRAMWV